jgi:hypothetical protein
LESCLSSDCLPFWDFCRASVPWSRIAISSVTSFSGIFSYLSQNYSGNVDEKGIVSMTVCFVCSSSYLRQYSVDMKIC